GEDLPKLWDAASVVERKQILRLVVKEVVLDQRPESGQVWIRIIWQTGAVSEHKVRRNVSSYRNYADVATLEARVRDLVVARKMDREIARALNADGLLSAHGRPFSGGEVHLLRKRWNIPTVKINRTEHIPDNGRMGHTPCKAPLRRFRFLHKPSSNGFRKDDYPATRS